MIIPLYGWLTLWQIYVLTCLKSGAIQAVGEARFWEKCKICTLTMRKGYLGLVCGSQNLRQEMKLKEIGEGL